MAVEKLAVSLDPELAALVRTLAESSGESVSGWLADAARRKIRNLAARVALMNYEEEFGAITPKEIAAARKLWEG